MVRGWGFDYEKVKKDLYDDLKDKIFSFSSDKKRSTAIIHLSDGTVRLYCKGASEWLLKDCTHYKNQSGIFMSIVYWSFTIIITIILSTIIIMNIMNIKEFYHCFYCHSYKHHPHLYPYPHHYTKRSHLQV